MQAGGGGGESGAGAEVGDEGGELERGVEALVVRGGSAREGLRLYVVRQRELMGWT